METTFTPWAGLLGGLLIGLASAGLLLANSKIAGISGILGRSLFPRPGISGGASPSWSACPSVRRSRRVRPATRSASPSRPTPRSSSPGGLLVGVGTQLGNGCTSGHGVCGIGRGSRRSIVATVVFMTTAGITVFVARHVFGGGA